MPVPRDITNTVLMASVLWAATVDGQNVASEAVDFVSQVRPILSDKCFKCHGPDESQRQADLRLDIESSAKSDLGGYHAIVAGNLENSELVARIVADDPSERMPPEDSGKQLSPAEIDLLKRWIRAGAVWQGHWAYVPPVKSNPPAVRNRAWPANWIDHYVLARTEAAGTQPAHSADRRTLVRRLYLDLLGLPPPPPAVEQFLHDRSPDAWEMVVDRLLASPHFGERLAMYWLDLVRYADTVGYHGDQDHNISPYRDWVIDALNDNMPFDQFTREQLAGDLLEDSDVDQNIAAAYNRLLQTSHEGGVQPGEYLAIYAADRVRNVSAVWLAATLGCAQCHDHKYDPFTTRDFYSMAAFFADIDDADHFTKGVNQLPTARPPEIKVFSRREREAIEQLEQEMAELDDRISKIDDPNHSLGGRRDSLAAELQRIRAAQRTIMLTRALDEPRVTRILPRGNWLDQSGAVVQPAVPRFLPPLGQRAGRATRLDLANWLTDVDTGAGQLTARVFANRIWHLFFGAGLSGDLADFGSQGQPPSHPELLDQLALEFVASGWNVKHLVRLIVTSQTYRQSSLPTAEQLERDPQNRLFSRQNRFRLPAELIRDNALAISGLLVNDIGGASVKPYQPTGYYRHLNFPPREYQPDLTPHRQWRRGVYVHWQRQFLQPMLKAFDAPLREECTAQRPRSNTPTAALTLLNDPTFVEAAQALAQRAINHGESFAERLEFAFSLAVSRPPVRAEIELLRNLYSKELTSAQSAGMDAIQTTMIFQPAQQTPEHAAWTSIARVILNLNETITRN